MDATQVAWRRYHLRLSTTACGSERLKLLGCARSLPLRYCRVIVCQTLNKSTKNGMVRKKVLFLEGI